MYKQEQIKPYEGTGDKGKLVEEMFDNIAPTYDTLNHRLSWDIDKGWRKKAIRRLAPFSPKKMLDIATGTGDFAILAAQMLHPDQLIGADISEGMMEIGRQKVKQLGLENTISFAKEDCLNLSFQDESFDAVTAAFGIRNFQNLDQGLKEMCRVLKKGGHLCIVEHHAGQFPDEAAVQYLQQHCLADVWQTHQQRPERLQLSQQDHRGIPSGRGYDGGVQKGRIRKGRVQATHLRHLHTLFRNQIK